MNFTPQHRRLLSSPGFIGKDDKFGINYSGREAARVKVSVALLNTFFFIFGVAMGREIRLRATSYCSRSRFSRPAFNRGPAFINEMPFSVIFPC